MLRPAGSNVPNREDEMLFLQFVLSSTGTLQQAKDRQACVGEEQDGVLKWLSHGEGPGGDGTWLRTDRR